MALTFSSTAKESWYAEELMAVILCVKSFLIITGSIATNEFEVAPWFVTWWFEIENQSFYIYSIQLFSFHVMLRNWVQGENRTAQTKPSIANVLNLKIPVVWFLLAIFLCSLIVKRLVEHMIKLLVKIDSLYLKRTNGTRHWP